MQSTLGARAVSVPHLPLQPAPAAELRLRLASAQWPPPSRSGDLIELSQADDGTTTIFVGDVCGNGDAAGPLAARVRRLLGSRLRSWRSMRLGLQSLNAALERELSPGLFVTAVAARIDPHQRTITVASAGHLGPFIRRRDGGSLTASTPGGPPLGIVAGLQYGNEVVSALGQGDMVLFATDGVTDRFATACDPTGESGLLDQLEQLPPDAPAMCRRLLWQAGTERGSDATVLAIELAP